MGQTQDEKILLYLRRTAAGLGLAVCLVGLASMFGWFLDLDFPRAYLASTKTMKFNSAALFTALGAALYLRAIYRDRFWKWGVAAACAALFFAVPTMIAYLLRIQSIPLDQLLYPEGPGHLFTHHPGRMAPSTAGAFILAAITFLLAGLRGRRPAIAREALALTVMLTGFLILIGYLYFGRFLFYTGIYITPMSVPSALALTLLGAGLLIAEPEKGLMTLTACNSEAGRLLRLLLPAALAVPFVVGLLRIEGEHTGLYGPEAGITLMILTTILLLGSSIYLAARSVRRQELKKDEKEARLAEANKELEAFSYSVSHDLRAPLRGIEGFSKILQEDYGTKLDAEAQRIIGVIRHNTLKMAQLIEDMLAFSRVARAAVNKEKVDMTELAREAWRDAAPEEKAGLCGVPELPPATGDRTMLKQVWANLFENALKFTSKNAAPKITASCVREGAYNVYTVKDNGAGFDQAYAGKLFGIFQRLHTEQEFPGTGVGLALSNRVVTKHGGWMKAEGSPGKGAAFYFALPVISADGGDK